MVVEEATLVPAFQLEEPVAIAQPRLPPKALALAAVAGLQEAVERVPWLWVMDLLLPEAVERVSWLWVLWVMDRLLPEVRAVPA